MYGRLADTEMLGAGAHGRTRFQNIFRAFAYAPLHILPHSATPPFRRCYSLCRIMGIYDLFTAGFSQSEFYLRFPILNTL